MQRSRQVASKSVVDVLAEVKADSRQDSQGRQQATVCTEEEIEEGGRQESSLRSEKGHGRWKDCSRCSGRGQGRQQAIEQYVLLRKRSRQVESMRAVGVQA